MNEFKTLKANNAEIKIGKNPAECHLIIDGKEVRNVVDIKLSLDVENGPILKYYTIIGGIREEVTDVDFDIIVDHEARKNQLLKVEEEQKRILTLKDDGNGRKYFG